MAGSGWPVACVAGTSAITACRITATSLIRGAAYKHADGKKIDGRRVLVDVERARTVKGWRPRRLGGGLGSTRKSRDEDPKDETAPGERRERSRSRDRRRRSRSPVVRRRSKSRERRRSRERPVPDAVERRRSRSRERKKPRRSRSRDRKRSRSRDRKRTRRSRSRDRRRDKDDRELKAIKVEKPDDGYPGTANGEDAAANGAPRLEEGEAQPLTEYPAPLPEVKAEDD